MNKVKAVAVLVMACALVVVAVLSSCSCSQQSSSSSSKSEKLEVSTEVSASSSSAISKDPFYVLIVGNDSREGTVEISKEQYADGTGRSDTMMLARVEPATHKITLVTVPRDTKAYLEDGTACKINECYRQGGMEGALKAVEELTGVKAKYYLNTTFVGFEDIVNALGGISMYVPFDQSMEDIVSGQDIEFSAGDQTMNGAEALVFARERKAYGRAGASNEEACRQTNDRAIMRTIMQTIMAAGDKAESLVKAVYPFVETNMTLEELTAYVKDFAANADKVTFLDGTGPYDGDIDDETELWLATRDEDTWRQVIAVVDEGGDPNTVIQAPSI